MGDNGISEYSKGEVSTKVSLHIMNLLDRGTIKPSKLSSVLVMHYVLKETGFPVDHEDLSDTVRRTLNLIIKNHKTKDINHVPD